MIQIQTTISIDSPDDISICSNFVQLENLEWSVEYLFKDGDLYASLSCMRNYKDYPQITQWEAMAMVAYKIRRGSETIINTEPNSIIKRYFKFGDDLQLAHRERVASKNNLIDKFKWEQKFLVEANISDIWVRKPTEITLSELDEKQEFLGEGVHAKVFKGKYKGELVAVKRFYEWNKESYRTEINTLLKVNHRNLLRMIRHYDVDHFIVFEYCPSTLYEKLRDPTFVLKCALFTEWVNQMVEAIHYLHQEHITHRDIKSKNILLTKDDVLRLGDFGTAKPGEISNMSCVSDKGTVGYMAPEIKQNGPYTRKVDVYSFGVVVWEMATRKRVLPEWENKVLDQAHSQQSANDSSDRKLPATLHTMISQCTKNDAALRPSSAELQDDENGLWECASMDIRKHRKEWPEKFNANGWDFKLNYSDNTNNATAIGLLQKLQISSDTVKKEPATTVSTSRTIIKGDVYTTCIANASNDDFLAAVGNRSELQHPEKNNFEKFVRIAAGTFHQFAYPKTQQNVHYSIFRMNKSRLRVLNCVPPNRSVLCDGKNVFLTRVGNVWEHEAQLQMLCETL